MGCYGSPDLTIKSMKTFECPYEAKNELKKLNIKQVISETLFIINLILFIGLLSTPEANGTFMIFFPFVIGFKIWNIITKKKISNLCK